MQSIDGHLVSSIYYPFLQSLSKYRDQAREKEKRVLFLLLDNIVLYKRTHTVREERNGEPLAPQYFPARSRRDVSKATATYRFDEHITTCDVEQLCRHSGYGRQESRDTMEKGGRAREATPANRCHKARTCVRTGEGGPGQSRDVTWPYVSQYSLISARTGSSPDSQLRVCSRQCNIPAGDIAAGDLIRLISSAQGRNRTGTLIYGVSIST